MQLHANVSGNSNRIVKQSTAQAHCCHAFSHGDTKSFYTVKLVVSHRLLAEEDDAAGPGPISRAAGEEGEELYQAGAVESEGFKGKFNQYLIRKVRIAVVCRGICFIVRYCAVQYMAAQALHSAACGEKYVVKIKTL
jgi:hypothetical protein